MAYIFFFLLAFAVSAALVPPVKFIARRFGAIDIPGSERKIHTRPIPLLGGFAIFASLAIVSAGYVLFFHPNTGIIPYRFYWGLFGGGLVLMVTGFLDDKFKLAPRYSFIGPVLASLVLVSSGVGVGITLISNPFNTRAPIYLSHYILAVPLSAIFIFFFILGMTYTVKFLDGLDGLSSGITFISSLTLFFLSLTPKINQSITATIAIIFCGAVFGFLVYNFNPASIFAGEGGSTFMGFMLGGLSVLLGGKIATAVLVMGIPILDVAWVIVRRIWYGSSPFQADRKHLHFRLLDIGFSQRQTVFILYFLAAAFGFVAIFLQSLGKLISLVILLVIMLVLAISTVIVYKNKHERER